MATRNCSRCKQPYLVADKTLPNAARDYTPFCSKRCADIDLVHWLKGDYVIDGSGGLSIGDGEDADIMPGRGDLSSPFDEDRED